MVAMHKGSYLSAITFPVSFAGWTPSKVFTFKKTNQVVDRHHFPFTSITITMSISPKEGSGRCQLNHFAVD